MCARWVKGYEPDLIVDDIKQLDKTANGKVAFPDFQIQHVLAVLCSAVDVQEMPELEKETILKDAVWAVAAMGSISSHSLLKEISRRENELLRQPTTRFVMLSSLSFAFQPRLNKRRVHGAELIFTRTAPKRYDRSALKDHLHDFEPSPTELRFTVVRTAVNARNPTHAHAVASEALDLWRGIWNLYVNMGTNMRRTYTKRTPVNDIRTGHIHTLHLPGGPLASDLFWYNPGFHDSIPYKDWGKIYPKVCKFERHVHRRLKGNKHAGYVEYGIRMYVIALDETRLDAAFTKLWSTLEHCTGTQRDSYDVTIRRVVVRCKTPRSEQQVLMHLRDHRNRAVHRLDSSNQSETLVYQLKHYVEDMLMFLINRLKTFETLEECWQFLDSPRSKEDLQRRIRISKRALKLLERHEAI